MPASFRRTSPAPEAWGELVGIAFISVVVHLLCITRYGFFRDELYYLDCSKRLAWGYVDHPPLSVFLLRLQTSVLGVGLFQVRLLSVAETALTILVTGALTARVGGGRSAQILSALVVLAAPVYLAVSHLYSMNALDVLLWAVCTYCFVRSFQENSTFYWILFGVALGLGLLNKLDVLWLLVGLACGLLVTEDRRVLANWRPWLGIAIALSMFSPYLVWQIQNGWPSVEFIRNSNAYKLSPVGPIQFIVTQLLVMGPFSWIVWLSGWREGFIRREWHPLSIAFLLIALMLILNGRSRENYLSPAYILIVPMGAATLERSWKRDRKRVPRLTASIGLAGLAVAPLALPILSPGRLANLISLLPAPPAAERGAKGPLQGFSDMFGWQDQVRRVSIAFDSLSPDERASAAIFTHNYGEAGAVDLYGRRFGLPTAISGHNNYWIWGPGAWNGDIAILVGQIPAGLLRQFTKVDTIPAPKSDPTSFAVPEEASAPIYVCHRLRCPVSEFWREARHFE